MSMISKLATQLFTNCWGQSNSGPSPRIWSKVSAGVVSPDGGKRPVLAGDDFLSIQHAGTLTDLLSELAYVVKSDDTSNHTLVGAADEPGGVLQLNIDSGAGANEEIGIASGDATQQLGQISDTAGSAYMTAFEARFKVSNITNGKAGVFIGLMSPGKNAGDMLVDSTGVPNATTCAYIGFNVKADDGDSLDFVYGASGQAIVEKIAGIGTLAVDTYIKVGFLYDPAAPPAKRIKVYVNNVENATYVTKTNIETATFPDAEALCFNAGIKGIAGSTALEMAIDWWAFAQLID